MSSDPTLAARPAPSDDPVPGAGLDDALDRGLARAEAAWLDDLEAEIRERESSAGTSGKLASS